jgi:hypothetical protein
MQKPQLRQWRDEKVFIVFHAHSVQLKDKKVGDWVVTPGDKPISRGQKVTWQTFSDVDLELFLPDVFEPNHIKTKRQASATLRDNAPDGYYTYAVYCDGQLATASSPPGIIVDA